MARRPRYRPWPRKLHQRARSGRGIPWLLAAVIGVGLALLCIHAFDAAVRPLATDMAQAKVRNAVTAIVDGAVERTMDVQAVSYSDIVTLQTDGEGRINALVTSPVKLNTLRTAILEDVIQQVDALDTTQLGIPIGSLTGLVYASDWGPLLPVRVLSAAAADGDFRNEFTSAGINQTLHRILLDVDVDVKLLLPGGTVETAVHTTVCLAETVIVGEVPQAYLQAGGAA
jgi:sporulation protein YunB